MFLEILFVPLITNLFLQCSIALLLQGDELLLWFDLFISQFQQQEFPDKFKFVHVVFFVIPGLRQQGHYILDGGSFVDSILQASLYHLDQRVGLSQLAQDLLHVVVTTLKLSATDHNSFFIHVCSCEWFREGLREKENGHDTEREDIDCDVVF